MKQYIWHVWFTELKYVNGWAPNFRYEMASGTRTEAVAKMKELKKKNPSRRYRITKYRAVLE
jgi:hypothetical protein